MTIDSASGVVSWPAATVVGSPYAITLRATNSNGSSDATWQLLVVVPPVVAPLSNDDASIGLPYTGPIPVLQPATLATWSLVSGPPGMTIDPASGVVSWPSPAVDGSPYTITIRASNVAGSGDATWQLRVLRKPPAVAPIPDDYFIEGVPYTGPQPALLQGTPPITWSLVAGPAGTTIDPSTGQVTWANPTAAGAPYTFTIRATNDAGSSDATWHIGVLAAPVLQSIGDQTATEGQTYLIALSLANVTRASWQLLSGPDGATINAGTGLVTWPSPVKMGSPYTFTVQAANEAGSDQKSWLVSVKAPPKIAGMSDAYIRSGTPYSSPAPTLTVGQQGATWTLVAGPAGMTIDPGSGIVSWSNPIVAGSPFVVTIRATNEDGTDTKSWGLTVMDAPVIADIPDAITKGGAVIYMGAMPSLVQGTQPVTWSLVSGPAGMTVEPTTGAVTWVNPVYAATLYAVTIRAANAVGSADWTWHVTVLDPPVIQDIPDATVAEGVPYTGPTPVLLQSNPPVTWSLVSGPAGMTIDPATGVVSWPKPQGSSQAIAVTIKASDTHGSATITWHLTIPASYTATVSANPHQAPAGTPVTLQGVTAQLGSGVPVPNVPVTIRIHVQTTRRVIQAMADASGRFEAIFRPLATEAGIYEVGADHPAITTDKTDDTFTLYGLQCSPASMVENLIPGQLPQIRQITLSNLGDTPLTGLTATVEGAASNLSVQTNIPEALPVFGQSWLRYTVVAEDPTIPDSSFTIRLSSSEGAVAALAVSVYVSDLVPHLTLNPSSLSAGMLLGGQALVQVNVTNDGGVETGEVHVDLPSAAWMSLATSQIMPSINPGGTAAIVLSLAPGADLALGPYSGTIVAWCDGSSVTLPFTFNAISNRQGDLQVTAVDEYTYYADGSPKVGGATVTVNDTLTGQLIATAITDSTGSVQFHDFTEAYYDIGVSASGHGSFHTQVMVAAAQTQSVTAFLPRQLVNYTWTVVPTQVEDQYNISIQATFETHVPAPVVTVDPALIDLDQVGCDAQIDLTITNHGLVPAKAAQMLFGDNNSRWEVSPLVQQIGDIPPESSVVVPVRIHDKTCVELSPSLAETMVPAAFAAPSDTNSGFDSCTVPWVQVQYQVMCDTQRLYSVPVGFWTLTTLANCSGPKIPWGPGPGGPGGSGGGPALSLRHRLHRRCQESAPRSKSRSTRPPSSAVRPSRPRLNCRIRPPTRLRTSTWH